MCIRDRAELDAASERVKPIWRTARACSLVLTELLQEPTTELSTAPAAEPAPELLAEVPVGLLAARAAGLRPERLADSENGS